MSVSRRRLLFVTFTVACLVCGVIWHLVIRQEPISEQTAHWSRHITQSEDLTAFYRLAGFDAAKDAVPALYGQQKWQHFIDGSTDQEALSIPSDWRFGLPCLIKQVECLRLLAEQQDALKVRVEQDALWLSRLQTLLEGAAPLAPAEQQLRRFNPISRQLSSAFELQIGTWIYQLHLTEADPRAVFAQLNQHLHSLFAHINHTNIEPYRRFLLTAVREELSWLVAQLAFQPNLKATAIEELDIFHQNETLTAPLQHSLYREFANSASIFEQIEGKGISQTLGWTLQVSEFFKSLTWRKNSSLNTLAEQYLYAIELLEGKHGIEHLAQAAERWPNEGRNWQGRNLVGALLLRERLHNLSRALNASLQAKAYYAIVRTWLLNLGEEQALPETIRLFGQDIALQDRKLEQRLCLQLPKLDSLDEHCIRLFDSAKSRIVE